MNQIYVITILIGEYKSLYFSISNVPPRLLGAIDNEMKIRDILQQFLLYDLKTVHSDINKS